MPDDLLEGPKPSFSLTLVERDYLVPTVISAPIHAVIDERANFDELDPVIGMLDERRFVAFHAHQNHMVITQLIDVELFTNTRAECGDQVADLFGGEDLVFASLLDVEDLAAQLQDRLESAISGVLRRSPRGIALDHQSFPQHRSR